MRALVALRRGVPAVVLVAAPVLVSPDGAPGAGPPAPSAEVVALAKADPAGVAARVTALERGAEHRARRLGVAPRIPRPLPPTAEGLASRLQAAERVGAFLAAAREAPPSRLPRTLPGWAGASPRVDAVRHAVRLGLRPARATPPTDAGWADVAAWLARRREALRDEERPFGVPARGAVTSLFGPRWARAHEGLDIAGPAGTPVRAAAAGRVTAAGWYGGYGLRVVIAHPDGLSTAYAHLAAVRVRPGRKVARGAVIGTMGTTGFSTGIHLHFEIRRATVALDPMPYLPPLPLSPEARRGPGVLIGTVGVPATWALPPSG
ncbi:MAG: M23 family metallopeptidase [Thermoleophilia bacterium]